MNDDPFEEHLNNPKSIKETLVEPIGLCLLEPSSLVTFLQTAIKECLGQEANEISCNILSWLVHSLRLLCLALVQSTSPENSSNVDSIRASRAQALIETICLILNLKQPIQDYSAANSTKLPECTVERLNYAYIKAIESVAKSFLSRCLPYDTQDELTKYIAEKLALQSRDLLLTTLIEMALCSLRGAKSGLIKKCALKILVHLTVTKPYVPPET